MSNISRLNQIPKSVKNQQESSCVVSLCNFTHQKQRKALNFPFSFLFHCKFIPLKIETSGEEIEESKFPGFEGFSPLLSLVLIFLLHRNRLIWVLLHFLRLKLMVWIIPYVHLSTFCLFFRNRFWYRFYLELIMSLSVVLVN